MKIFHNFSLFAVKFSSTLHILQCLATHYCKWSSWQGKFMKCTWNNLWIIKMWIKFAWREMKKLLRSILKQQKQTVNFAFETFAYAGKRFSEENSRFINTFTSKWYSTWTRFHYDRFLKRTISLTNSVAWVIGSDSTYR